MIFMQASFTASTSCSVQSSPQPASWLTSRVTSRISLRVSAVARRRRLTKGACDFAACTTSMVRSSCSGLSERVKRLAISSTRLAAGSTESSRSRSRTPSGPSGAPPSIEPSVTPSVKRYRLPPSSAKVISGKRCSRGRSADTPTGGAMAAKSRTLPSVATRSAGSWPALARMTLSSAGS